MAAKFEIDVQPFLDVLKSSTDRLQGLTVCMEALDGLDETIEGVNAELAELVAEEGWEPTEETLAIAATKRAESLNEIHAIVAAIVATDRFLVEHKAEGDS